MGSYEEKALAYAEVSLRHLDRRTLDRCWDAAQGVNEGWLEAAQQSNAEGNKADEMTAMGKARVAGEIMNGINRLSLSMKELLGPTDMAAAIAARRAMAQEIGPLDEGTLKVCKGIAELVNMEHTEKALDANGRRDNTTEQIHKGNAQIAAKVVESMNAHAKRAETLEVRGTQIHLTLAVEKNGFDVKPSSQEGVALDIIRDGAIVGAIRTPDGKTPIMSIDLTAKVGEPGIIALARETKLSADNLAAERQRSMMAAAGLGRSF